MINELFQLSKAMEQAGVAAQSWHRKYSSIPNVSDKAPCFHIVFAKDGIAQIDTISKELGGCLRRYGDNQQMFPCCNMVPLYRVTDDDVKKKLKDLQNAKSTDFDIDEVRAWCIDVNWSNKFRRKLTRSLQQTPKELLSIVKQGEDGEPLRMLIADMQPFAEPQALFDALKDAAFSLLERRIGISTALQILLYAGDADKSPEDDVGKLSVAFDSERLIAAGIPAASVRFTQQLNRALLEADKASQPQLADSDAFGMPFMQPDEPMPTVKLAGGFTVALRTMFRENPCQFRYSVADDASYPISKQLRTKLHASLAWLGDAEHQYKTWVNLDKDEILFVYPHTLPKTNAAFVSAFKRIPNSAKTFEKEAEALISDLRGLNSGGARAHEDRLQVFILRKIDKGRTKLCYTRLTDPVELKDRAEAWSRGCLNLPRLPFGQPKTLFPMDAADVLNRIWKQDGTLATDKFKPIPHYRGLELLMERDEPVTQDMYMLAKSCISLAPYLGRLNITDRNHTQQIWWRVKDMLALCGILLDRLKRRRENYMESFPYQYGQLLKVSDELHTLYCMVVRKGEIPPQLAGGGLVQAATEFPIRTLDQLCKRMMPYITWAKSYRYRKLTEAEIAVERKDNPQAMLSTSRAGWLMYLYEGIAGKLKSVFDTESRFDDADKAQLFLGYLAALPKKHKSGVTPDETMAQANDTSEMEEYSDE